MKMYFSFLLLLSSLCIINSLYIYIEPREKKCLSDYRLANTSFDIVYYVSGQEEEKNSATIEDSKGNVLSKITNKKNYKFSQGTKIDQELKFCFENLASSKITLSFEFDYGTNDYSIISIRTIENFVHVVDNLEKKLKKLQFNIRNSAVRKRAHFTIAENIRKKINIYAFIKIGFLILFSIFQLMMITSIFKNVKVVKQININSERKPLKAGNKQEISDFL
jgi:hypothetical protein